MSEKNDSITWLSTITRPVEKVRKWLVVHTGGDQWCATATDLEEAGWIRKEIIEEFCELRAKDRQIYESLAATYDGIFKRKLELEVECSDLKCEVDALKAYLRRIQGGDDIDHVALESIREDLPVTVVDCTRSRRSSNKNGRKR